MKGKIKTSTKNEKICQNVSKKIKIIETNFKHIALQNSEWTKKSSQKSYEKLCWKILLEKKHGLTNCYSVL